ncbi:50S ribosomal protein L9 [Aliifodinibius salicampi]|jgi:large subunit ribosomal protein L9|uniref:Large ribosomal subunit protein bL9 n=1 Tax=Fodinibius salicampi TaxID=1920655 RepID=A0ABT3PX82_9BACT|nr:50S ribosomal protein L9 [Fodinibius salicampi]MCW9712480.1 50S ribosomal protein L9 [Fodinibius salicampi]
MANKYMKLILREDVEKLGDSGDIVEVKAGYGRNYLIPQGKAMMATDGALNRLERMKEKAERRAELTIESAQNMAEQLETTSVTIPVSVGEDERIHGSVTNQDVADALEERDITIDKRKISLDQDINTLGEYTATVNLVGDIKAQIKVWVVKK